MKIATFNINGIKARSEALPRWLAAEGADADVICLQEIKSVDDAFPRADYEALGYRVETHGQKGFNGVAILSRLPLSDIARGLPGDAADEQARWIEATVAGVRVVSLYLPNGNPAPGPKYDYKLAWMARMLGRARALMATEAPVVLAGDYNVIPEDRDARRPQAWVADALALPDSRAAFRRLIHLGLTEAVRAREPATPGLFTFWDYQAGAWDRDDGIRIDHLLLSPQAADRLTGAGIDRMVRAGDKPSDHVPVWATLSD
ncbi:MAG TPA: exodeoxyribonuclease III [Paracoccaceae bacterium]|nr:exodeoxyribonuclease III [Paracoccaceae bacterium]HMO71458.1 exodeoxyribonuclease III [Paracoccaceae bacterium]